MKARFLALAALVLGLASCQNDPEIVNPVVDGEVDFQLAVGVPELNTRAAENGTNDSFNHANSAYGAIDYLQGVERGDDYRTDWGEVDIRYSLEVYDKADSYTDAVPVKDRQVIIVDEYEPVAFDLRLVPGREYHFVVFADFVKQGADANPAIDVQDDLGLHHIIGDNLGDIKIKNDGINDECTDAYFAVKDITISNSAAQDMELKRPYGKLRVIATDLAELNINVDPAAVVVTYDAYHPNAFNAVTGAIGGKYETKEYVSVYNEGVCKLNLANHFYTEDYDNKKATNKDGVQRHTHMTLFTDYILANEQQAPIHFTMDVYQTATPNGEEYVFSNPIKSTHFNTEIPIQRNYLTTIVGNVLTTATEIKVTIDDNFSNANDPTKEPFYQKVWDGETLTEPTITTDTTTGEPVALINQASDLAWLANFVNGTLIQSYDAESEEQNFEGVKFVLNNNIDLNNEPWTPIGFNPNDVAGNEKFFTGEFDGNGFVISNLYIDVKDQGGVGLFGAVNNATIKNFTLRNVFVKAVESENDPANASGAEGKAEYIAGGHIGAVVGYDVAPWGTGAITFENVHVDGLIKIEGETRAAQGQRVGGIIGGRGYSKINFNNVSVIGDEGSYIKGYCSTAGVIGQGQGVSTFSNVTTDIPVYAVTFGAGGISGIACNGSTFTNCSSKGDVTLDASKTQLSSYSANYPFRVGGIAGCWSDSKTAVLTLTNCSYDGTLTSIDKDGNSPEAFDYAGYVGRGYALKNCAGSKVIVNEDEYVQVYDNVYGVYYINGAYEVNTVADLKALANDVNSGKNYFENQTVVLTADVNLKGEEWTPIGSAYKDHGFMGNFDGNGFIIKNLAIKNITPDSDGYVYGGLFGVTEGVDTNNQNYIKNLVIENVDIDLDGHIVAAAIAYPYYTDIENVTVKGNVSIKGGHYTAGVLGYTRRCVDATNIAIAANAGSVIEGNQTVGGVISDIQTNGGLEANYSNFAASDLTIKGNKNVGGISGIISKQTLNGATVTNVTIVCDDARKGIVSGSFGDNSSVIANATYSNVVGAQNIVGAPYEVKDDSNYSMTINGVTYEYNNGWFVDGCQVLTDGLLKENNTYIVKNANGLVVLSGMTINGGEIVTLGANIDLEGVEFNGLNAFNSESGNTFDGNGYTVSNWTNGSKAADMGFIRNWVGPIKNIKLSNCHLKTSGRSAIVAAKVYGNIENVEVEDSSIEDSYWACGIIAGLYNNGSISNCSVTNSSVKSNGGTAAIVGVFNESAGERGLKNCSVSNCTINNTGIYGEVYTGGALVGMFNCNATFTIEGCTVSNNTLEGGYVYEKYPADNTVTIIEK